MTIICLVVAAIALLLALISLIYTSDAKESIRVTRTIVEADFEARRGLLEHVSEVLAHEEKIGILVQESVNHSKEVIKADQELNELVAVIMEKVEYLDERLESVTEENEKLRDALYFDSKGVLGIAEDTVDDGK